jgi:hypothetical protein
MYDNYPIDQYSINKINRYEQKKEMQNILL